MLGTLYSHVGNFHHQSLNPWPFGSLVFTILCILVSISDFPFLFQFIPLLIYSLRTSGFKDYPFNPSNPCSSYHSLSLIPLIYFRVFGDFCVTLLYYLCDVPVNVYVAMYLFPTLMYFHKNVKKWVSMHCRFNNIFYLCTRKFDTG